ncbi:hypothetical protein BK816_08855 [Boudabousia tangfeifanii]|uniref:Photolyase/cryptochrome alpha/beta domain-containing protein n=1 Tax=Boudabousia tangfeifanii TaxID=1912795 RepID=A0A1D9MM41_9ACTO|nr:deoxyribodipyrimidine photo-lyase [Boudabousia tangfeifanii]AOZ73366.1 hypothetical protein BK816_08855 [Boudabousia tangfeifanii]
MSTSILWFRRDLRTGDHPALAAAATWAQHGSTPNGQNEQAEVLPVFIFDPAQCHLHGRWRYHALINGLQELNRTLDGRLLVLWEDPVTAISRLAKTIGANSVHVTDDYTPYAQDLYERVEDALDQQNLPLVRTGDPYLIPPGTITTQDGGNYKVFTAFSKRWFALPHPGPMPTKVRNGKIEAKIGRSIAKTVDIDQVPAGGLKVTAILKDPSEISGFESQTVNLDKCTGAVPEVWTTHIGEKQAKVRLEEFLTGPAGVNYDTDRDRMDRDGTSRLSTQLAYGTIHPRTILAELAQADLPEKASERYATEIAWREFYGDFLYCQPDSAWENVNPGFARFDWDDDQEKFEKWCQGQTGYPVVDAAMHQLVESGWMHNRARMVVASFLTKHLLLPWQWGAKFFLHHLVDAEFASNQHGWQWTAGTGTDASPYFRVFNPYLQGAKFDPEAIYIRAWNPALQSLLERSENESESKTLPGLEIPENKPHKVAYPRPLKAGKTIWLKELDAKTAKKLHEKPGQADYPEPIVDHKTAREEALRRYHARND